MMLNGVGQRGAVKNLQKFSTYALVFLMFVQHPHPLSTPTTHTPTHIKYDID